MVLGFTAELKVLSQSHSVSVYFPFHSPVPGDKLEERSLHPHQDQDWQSGPVPTI